MAPEDRLDRIETIIEKQNQEIDKQNAGIRDLTVVSRTVLTSIEELREIQRKDHEQIKRHDQEIDKQNAGIRDLILVSRTVLNSIQEFGEVQRKDHEEWTIQMKALRDAQAATDEKLNILIDTVDRIIRHRNGADPTAG